MKKLRFFLCVMALILGLVGTAHATLWDRGGGLVYDDVLNITWLQNANYAATELTEARISQIIASVGSVAGHTLIRNDFVITEGYGYMTWWGAMGWAQDLTYGGYTDWRLPKTVDGPWSSGYDGTTTGGWNITTSEMGHLYYVSLGNKGYYATDGAYGQPGWGLNNTGPFINFQPYVYWSTEYSLSPTSPWLFDMQDAPFCGGRQTIQDPINHYYAMAVRDGDVAPVPEPATMLLLASGLVGLAGLRRLRKR